MAAKLGSLLVLTEDGGPKAHATIVEVVKRMLKLIVPDYGTHLLGFEPKDERAQRAVQGTGWKSRTPEMIVALRTIATKLGRDDGFVLFHVDGDRTWARRESSENAGRFDKLIVTPVRQLLHGRRGATEADTEARLRRLFPIIPFYSIEAWLYQHTAVAIRICHESYQGRDAGRFDEWRKDRAALDDVEKPKNAVCLSSSHNLECAGSGYPAEEVFDAGRSYHACVLRLLECAELGALLEATAGRAARAE